MTSAIAGPKNFLAELFNMLNNLHRVNNVQPNKVIQVSLFFYDLAVNSAKNWLSGFWVNHGDLYSIAKFQERRFRFACFNCFNHTFFLNTGRAYFRVFV